MSECSAKPAAPVPPAGLENLPNWAELLRSDRSDWDTRRAEASGPKILVATTVGGGTAAAMSAVESLLAVALTWRGARVDIVLCDQQLPACKNLEWVTNPVPQIVSDGEWNQTLACAQCWETGRYLFEPLGLPIHRLSGQLWESDRRECDAVAEEATIDNAGELERQGRPIGEHALAGTLRYFARGELMGTHEEESVLKRYVAASVAVDIAVERLVSALCPDVVVTSHGLYVPYGIIQAVCRHRTCRFVTWNLGYRRRSVIVSEGETYHHSLQKEPVALWENLPWNEERERQTMDYLESRIWGKHDWIWFYEQPHERIRETLLGKGIDLGKPVISLLTNVIWDAQLHYPANAFGSMMAWLHDTLQWFQNRPQLQLVIRVHPAELKGSVPSRQRVRDEIGADHKSLPSNVFLIDAGEQVSTYALAELSDTVLVFGTKMGVELSAKGIPVVVAGEAWVRGKGITEDADSPEDYHRLLETLPRGLRNDAAQVQRARKYAYHFFFRRMIPVQSLRPAVSGWPPFHVDGVRPEDFSPESDPGLNCVLTGILEGAPFCYDGPWSEDLPSKVGRNVDPEEVF